MPTTADRPGPREMTSGKERNRPIGTEERLNNATTGAVTRRQGRWCLGGRRVPWMTYSGLPDSGSLVGGMVSRLGTYGETASSATGVKMYRERIRGIEAEPIVDRFGWGKRGIMP